MKFLNFILIYVNNLRYTDNTTLMAESKEELRSLLMKAKKESEKGGLKLNIEKTKIMVSGPISSVQLLSHVWLFAIPWTAPRQASLSITNSWSSLKLTSIELSEVIDISPCNLESSLCFFQPSVSHDVLCI